MIRFLFIGLIAFLIVFLEKKLFEYWWDSGLNIELSFSKSQIHMDEPGILSQSVENNKFLPLPSLCVKFLTARGIEFENSLGSNTTDNYYRNDIYQVKGNEKITRSLSFQGGKRGYYTIREATLIASDFMLSGHYIKNVPVNTHIYILPRLSRLKVLDNLYKKINETGLILRQYPPDPFEFAGIRDYMPYDDHRFINWKATSKSEDLKVNHTTNTRNRSVNILLLLSLKSLRFNEEISEECISVAATYLTRFQKDGFGVGLISDHINNHTGKGVIFAPFGGKEHLNEIMRNLACLDLNKPDESFTHDRIQDLLKGQDDLIIISPDVDPKLSELIKERIKGGKNSFWIVPFLHGCVPQIPKGCEFFIKAVNAEI
ncbi:MAG: DUF58 domain-containing protein [Lachnospiraceae bacterium]|nr:DUF58 domain-containing protein [Lachnospiraceae bacterium]